MGSSTADETELRGRLEAVGFDAKTDLASDDTITQQTLAKLASRSGRGAAALLEPATEVDVDVDGLPRITLSTASNTGEAPAIGAPGDVHDLVQVAVLGEGGMGRVVLARQPSLGREVAVKTLRSDASRSDVLALVREARVTGALEHPSIVPVHALGRNEEGQPLIVMKRVEGVSWHSLLATTDHPAWSALLGEKPESSLDAHLDILLAVCRSLELAHARGILHRDIKPANVMVGPFGEVYLVDWGIATSFAEGAREMRILGTPGYMAPEMAKGAPVDARTDVYLLGATLHRVLTGKPRHEGSVLRALLAAADSKPARYPADVPAPLAELCNRACAADRALRPPSVHAFREQVVAFQRHRSAFAICAVAGERLTRLERLLGDASGGTPPDLAGAYRLATEARFGFTQSLEQFPEQGAAREGAARCIASLVDLELRQGHVDTAAALLDELADAAPALVARIAAARAAAAVEAREHERLRSVDRQLDPTIERRARVLALAIVLPMIVAITVVLRLVGPRAAEAPLTNVVIVGAILSSTVTAVLVLRRRLLASALNRTVAGMMIAVQTAMLAHSIVGVLRQAPTAMTMADNLLVFATVLAVGALTTLPRLAVCIPGLLVAMVLLDVYPAQAAVIMPAVMTLTIGSMLWAITTHRRAVPAKPEK